MLCICNIFEECFSFRLKELVVCSLFVHSLTIQKNICLLIYAFKMWGISILIIISIVISLSLSLSLSHTHTHTHMHARAHTHRTCDIFEECFSFRLKELVVCSFITIKKNICLLIYAFKMWGISILIIISVVISLSLSLSLSLSHMHARTHACTQNLWVSYSYTWQ